MSYSRITFRGADALCDPIAFALTKHGREFREPASDAVTNLHASHVSPCPHRLGNLAGFFTFREFW